MIDRYLGPTAEAAFLDSVGTGSAYRFQLAGLIDADLRRMAELMRAYADRRLGGTDASVIAVCERLAVATVATVNRRDFVFATFTAPSFGPVHTRVELSGGKIARCRPRRKASYCPHGLRLSCGQRHKENEACLGRPLCLDC
jgi:Replication initiator protein, pSAM2